jgi:hypothetical protein
MLPPEFFADAYSNPAAILRASVLCLPARTRISIPASLHILEFRFPAPTCGGHRIGPKYDFGLGAGTLIARMTRVAQEIASLDSLGLNRKAQFFPIVNATNQTEAFKCGSRGAFRGTRTAICGRLPLIAESTTKWHLHGPTDQAA